MPSSADCPTVALVIGLSSPAASGAWPRAEREILYFAGQPQRGAGPHWGHGQNLSSPSLHRGIFRSLQQPALRFSVSVPSSASGATLKGGMVRSSQLVKFDLRSRRTGALNSANKVKRLHKPLTRFC